MFWWFILICNLILPVLMIISGRLMWKHCPKKINGIYGYRTRRSQKNQETWKFAHEHCGKLWWKLGWIMLPVTVLVHIPFMHSEDKAVGTMGLIVIMVQCMMMILSIAFTENALKRNFEKKNNA